ncbi:MAG: ISAs1 family transposase [Spirochaetaceae bacterium]|jgi:predicted transposase YbfD/YdcC|nr:ISAs1 family transposase [Spirochaetaceae bacterium]
MDIFLGGDMDIGDLREKLKGVTDPRRPWGNLRHKLEDILVIGLAALVCNGSDFEDMEAFGAYREAELRKFLELPNGIPDESTFFRVFKRIQPEQLGKCLYEWLAGARETEGRAVNIDGKTIRGSGGGGGNPVHVVSAWAGEEEIVLGQLAVDEKSNEIRAIPRLLELLDVRGSVITIDAMGCQTEIAGKVREKQADYLLAVKDNQPGLHGEIREYFEGLEGGEIRDLPDDLWVTGSEKGHGRIERREIRVVSELGWLSDRGRWKDLKTIIQYRGYRTVRGETVKRDRYYISSAEMNADEMCRRLRGHWSIENKLHWSLDVVFGEDRARVSRGHGPENLNILRKTALSLLRAAPLPEKHITRMSGPKRRFAASLCADYMFTVPFGK